MVVVVKVQAVNILEMHKQASAGAGQGANDRVWNDGNDDSKTPGADEVLHARPVLNKTKRSLLFFSFLLGVCVSHIEMEH